LYVTTPSLALGGMGGHYVAIFDNRGVPVWWYRDAGTPIDAKLLPGHLIAYATFNGADPSYQVRRLDGTLVSKVRSPDGEIDDHELQETAEGNDVYLVYQPKQHVDITSLGGPADATVLEGRIEEIAPNGKVVWSWSTDGHVDPSESIAWAKSIVSTPIDDASGAAQYDVYHANSVSISGNLVVVSMRYENAIFGIDRKTGNILWKLGGTPTPQSLTVVGDPHPDSPFSGQHDARILAGGTISLFDDESLTGEPRAVEFKVDAAARKATLLRSLSDPTITMSACCGSARVLSDGDWLVSWGGDPTLGEYATSGAPLLRIQFAGVFSYRAVPVAVDKLPIGALREGMDEVAGDDPD
jgi:outer membrane protein assembly factor BamB